MFYTINQNNSGGYFIENDDVREYLIIEADSVDEANDKLYDITQDYSEYCSCCGKRWSNFNEDNGSEEPMIRYIPVDKVEEGVFRHSCIIYYKNGDKRIVKFEKR